METENLRDIETRCDKEFISFSNYTDFDISLSKLQEAGYTRHPRPQEYFRSKIARHEKQLSPEQKELLKHTTNHWGIWLSAAFERIGDKLIVYADPEGLVSIKEPPIGYQYRGCPHTYVKENFRFSDKQEFHIGRIKSQQNIYLNGFDQAFAEFMYSRPYKQLPKEMRTKMVRPAVYIPLDGQIHPVAANCYDLDCNDYFAHATIGVRDKN